MDGIVLPFIAILASELFDKSQLSIFLLATRTKRYLLLFFGAIAAFIVVDGIAILAGSYLTTFLPNEVAKFLSGSIFIIFGIVMLFKNEKEVKEKAVTLRNAFFTSFTVVFLSEWGDKTQLTTGLLATQHNPYFVFVGVMTAFAILTFLAIFFGDMLSRFVNKQLLNKIAGIIFITMGLLFLML